MVETVLETRKLTKEFGGFRAVDQVDLRVRRGEFHSIIGPNGAGKTTLFNLLSGALRPTAGSVYFKGIDITGLPPHRITRLGLGRSFQTTNLFSNLSVWENVRVAVQGVHEERGGERMPLLARLLKPAGALREVNGRAEAIVSQVGLEGREALPAHALAHGDKRKLELGILLASDPEVLLLDEPTAGMSREEVPAIMKVVGGLRAGGRRTILLVEHKMDIVLSVSDRITVLQSGAAIARGTPDEIVQNPAVLAAYLGGLHEQPA